MPQIVQKSFWHGRQELELSDDIILKVKYCSGSRYDEFVMDISQLDETPVRSKNFARKWLWGILFSGLLTSLLSLAIIALACDKDDGESMANALGLTLPLLILLTITVMCVRSFFKERFDILKFHGKYSDTTLVLYYNKPNQDDFDSFVGILRERIKKHSASKEQSSNIAKDLERLVNLKDAGYLTEQEYVIAKTACLGNIKEPIGFKIGSTES